MATFVIISGPDVPPVGDTVRLLYPDAKIWNDRAHVIKADGTARSVADQITSKTGVRQSLFVCRLTADYYGFAKSDFWDWLAASFTDSSND